MDDELVNRQTLREILIHYDLEIEPPLGSGESTLKRVLKQTTKEALTTYNITLIAEGETDVCEFKSSFAFDRNKFFANQPIEKSMCFSESTIFTALKAVASFLNTNGGNLFIGIADDGEATGLEDDFECIPGIKRDFDGFDLYFRSRVQKAFVDGDSVNAYIKLRKFQVSKKLVAQCSVAARSDITFLKKENQPKLYIRRGTSSAEIPYENIEEYYSLSKRF